MRVLDVIRWLTLKKEKSREQLIEELRAVRTRVAEFEQTERALRSSESMHVAMMDAIDDGIHINDADGRYLANNAEMARRQGMSKEDVLGRTSFGAGPTGSHCPDLWESRPFHGTARIGIASFVPRIEHCTRRRRGPRPGLCGRWFKKFRTIGTSMKGA